MVTKRKIREKADATAEEDLFLDAAAEGNIGLIERFLRRGGNINCRRTENGWSALMEAVYSNHVDIVNLLLRRGIDPKLFDKYKCTALHLAACEASGSLVQQLLLHGADPNIKLKRIRETPLMIACGARNIEAALVLVRYGANFDVVNQDGMNALKYFPLSMANHVEALKEARTQTIRWGHRRVLLLAGVSIGLRRDADSAAVRVLGNMDLLRRTVEFLG